MSDTLSYPIDKSIDKHAFVGIIETYVPLVKDKAVFRGYCPLCHNDVHSYHGFVLDPDEQVRGVVQLVFDKCEELGTVNEVFRYLRRNKIQLGFRCKLRSRRGQLEWRHPTATRILAMLRHPIYAGAYAYGLHRHGRKNPVTGEITEGKTFLPPDEVRVLIQDRVPPYISWEQYLANQRRISENRSLPSSPGSAARTATLL